MSIFDPPNDKKLSDDYPPGTTFILYAGTYEGVRDTSFGPQSSATVKVGPVDQSSEPLSYKVWGTLADQVAQIETGDLPQTVKIGKQGNRNVWIPTNRQGEPPADSQGVPVEF